MVSHHFSRIRLEITVPLIACPDCSAQVSSLAHACPTCGFPVRSMIPPPPPPPGSPVSQLGQIKVLHAAWSGTGDPVPIREAFAEELNQWVRVGWEVTSFQVVPIVGPKKYGAGEKHTSWMTNTIAINWTAMLTYRGS
jgi:hypothetical protein